MNIVKQVYDCTLELLDILQADIERNDKIDQIEEVLDQREEFIQQMSAPYTDEEKQLGKRLIEMNQKVNQMLQREKLFIQKDLKDLSVKKESNTKYTNPYQNLSTDGMFYDKRK